MSIETTYRELILEKILREILQEGATPSVSELNARFDAYITDKDLSQPVFNPEDFKAISGSSASATTWNATNAAILQDISVLYRHLLKISAQSGDNFERWRAEIKLLNGQLNQLEERINSLLLVSEDTAGYFNFFQDTFNDQSKIDGSQTTAKVDVDRQLVTIDADASSGATRIDLTQLKDKDVQFTVLSRNNLVSVVSAPGSKTTYAVSDVNNYWQERVYLSKPGPVTGELKIDLGSVQTLSRIDIDLHQSSSNSATQVVPFLSTDNYSFAQLPISDFSRSITDKTTFQFPATQARYIKILLTKQGFDVLHNQLYSYEFGVDEISFYHEGFSTTAIAQLITTPLSVTRPDGQLEQFSKVTLETCEIVPDGTQIDYYVAASNDASFPVAGANFVSIDSLDRSEITKPTIVDFGDPEDVSISGLLISHDLTTNSGVFVNPSRSYTLVTGIAAGEAVTQSGYASALRYSFVNRNDRILNYTLASGVQLSAGVELWRNISYPGDERDVRDVRSGWGFSEPYYKTTVHVDNAGGITVDFGGKTIVVDGEAKQGRVFFSEGHHIISVHKDNWKYINASTVSNLSTLKTADTLYPYNHRYLIEGFAYPSGWSTTEEKVYLGFDIVGEFLAKQVSVFDLQHNVAADDYSKFAIDTDAKDAAAMLNGVTFNKDPSRVFLLKVDDTNPDFINEKFLLKFSSVSSLYKYLRFKAVLSTTDTELTPALEAYRIKLGT